MSGFVPESGRLTSELLRSDPGMIDIVTEFVAGLAGRICELRSAYEQRDYPRLAMLAHRLKGAGGSYGYPPISALAAQMEAEFRAMRAGGFAEWVRTLEALTQAAANGLVSSGTCTTVQ
jgi:HPt (histidine-containing phosphotransfer) domain-containing protein